MCYQVKWERQSKGDNMHVIVSIGPARILEQYLKV